MKIFKSKTDLNAEISALTEQLTEAATETADLEATIKTLQGDIVAKDEASATVVAELATLTEAKASGDAEVAQLTADLAESKAETQKEADSAAARAVDMAAKAGHEMIKLEAKKEDVKQEVFNSPTERLSAHFKKITLK